MKTEYSEYMNLPSLALSVRVLFTGYLLAIGLGLLMAGMQILLTHGMADGKVGVSVDDIVYSYYGNRENSKLESKLNGSMKDKASSHDRAQIIKWVREGASEEGWNTHIDNIFEKNCVFCHDEEPGLPDFTKFENVKLVSDIDEGASIGSLTRVSHIHLFGISFIFFFVGLIFSFAVGIPNWLKVSAIALPFLFLIVDVMSWWLTKWVPVFAWFTLIGGFGYTLASGFMWFTSVYQMWVLPYKKREFNTNEWAV